MEQSHIRNHEQPHRLRFQPHDTLDRIIRYSVSHLDHRVAHQHKRMGDDPFQLKSNRLKGKLAKSIR